MKWRKEGRGRRTSCVRGVHRSGGGVRRDLERAIGRQTGRTSHIEKWEKIKEGTLVRLSSIENKIDIMKNNYKRGGGRMQITDDWTRREKEIQRWIEKQAEEMRRNGKAVYTGHQKIQIEGVWKKWNEEEGAWETEDRRRMRYHGGKGWTDNRKGFRDYRWN